MATFFRKYKYHLTDRDFVVSLLIAVSLLLASLVIQFYAGTYATKQASNSVTDIVLSNIRVFDVDLLFVYGPVLLWAFVIFLCLREPKRLPFVLKSASLFILTRSLFISLTHIGPFPTQLVIESRIIDKFTFSGDLFFSGHVGIPFLMALVFWGHPRLRLLFIAVSVSFAVVVLMGHLHYTIDVVAAFFITYTIYHIALFLFPKDQKLFASADSDSFPSFPGMKNATHASSRI